MTLFIFAYAAGLLTIASPCIFPILPFVLGARRGLVCSAIEVTNLIELV
jgi:cytochrome c biogenesis protein CcdA